MQPTDDQGTGGPAWGAPPPSAPPTTWPTPPPGASPTPAPPAWPTPPPPAADAVPGAAPPPAPDRPDPVAAAPAPGPGALAALAGMVAALAPLLRWFDVDVAVVPADVSIFTNGWGSSGVDTDLPVPTDIDTAWGDWALAGIPDGAIATVLGVAAVLVGVRLALGLGSARRTLQAAVVTAMGIAGLAWMGVSWTSAQRGLSDQEDVVGIFGGVPEAQADDLFTLAGGPGFYLCAIAFAAVTLAGLAGLWSATGRVPTPLGAPTESGPPGTPWSPPSAPSPAADPWDSTPPPGRQAPPQAVPPAVPEQLGATGRPPPPPPAG